MQQLERIKQLSKEYKEAVQAIGTDLFIEALAPIFAKHEWLEEVGWTQGTPSFNDGDPCTFGVYMDEPFIVGLYPGWEDDKEIESAENFREEQRDEGYWPSRGNEKGSALYTANTDVGSVLSIIPEDVYEQVFGDGAQVYILRDGTFRTDYWDCGY